MTQATETTDGAKRPWLKPLLLIGTVIAVMVLAKVLGLDRLFMDLREWILSTGEWAMAVYVLFYVLATVAALPGIALTAIGGAVFGSVKGVILVSIASTIGASLAFLVGRYFARDAVSKWLSGNEKFRKLESMMEKQGAVVVVLTRLIPVIPFNILNYGLALTRVPFWTYVFWSWLGMLPATVVYVIGADTLFTAATGETVPWHLVAALVAAIVIAAGAVLYSRKRIAGEEGG